MSTWMSFVLAFWCLYVLGSSYFISATTFAPHRREREREGGGGGRTSQPNVQGEKRAFQVREGRKGEGEGAYHSL
jgi:hypothetical protein